MSSILVATGFIRIDSDTKPALKALKALGSIGGNALTVGLIPAAAATTTAVTAIGSAVAVAGGAVTAFGAAVVPQFKAITEAGEKQKTAEDAKTKATVNAGLAQKLATKYGFEYGEQVKITSTMSAEARSRAEEYNAALSTAQSSAKSAKQSQALYKEELAAMPPATKQTADALQTLKDRTKEWSDSLSSSTMPVFTQGIEFLTGLLPKLTPIVKSVSTEVKDFVGTLGEGTAGKVFREFGDNVTTDGAGALRTFLEVGKNLTVGLLGILNAFMPVQTQMSGGLQDLTKRFAEWGAGLGKSQGFDRFMSIAQDAGPRLSETLSVLGSALLDVASAAGPLSGVGLKILTLFAQLVDAVPTPVLKLLVPAILATNLAFKVYALYQAAAAAATWIFVTANWAGWASLAALRVQLIGLSIAQRAQALATGIATVATWAFNAAMIVATSPITLVVLAIAALAAGFYFAWKKSETFRNIVKGALGAVKDVGVAVGKWFAGPFVDFFTKTIPNAFQSVLDWVKKNWPWLIGALGGPIGLVVVAIIKYWDDIVDGLSTALTSVVDFFQKLPGRIVTGLGKLNKLLTIPGEDLIKGLLGGALTVAQTIGSWLKKWLLDPWVNGFKQLFGISSPSTVMALLGADVIRGMLKGALAIAQTIGTWLRSHVLNPTTNFFRNAGSWLLSAGRSIIGGLINGLVNKWVTANTWIRGRAAAFRSAMGNVGGYLISQGRDIIGGLLSGLKEKWGSAINWVKGLKNKVVSAIKSAFGISSPARSMVPLGVHIMAGLMKGILSQNSVLKSAVKTIFSSVTDVFKNGGSLLGDLMGSFGLGDSSVSGSAQQYAQLYLKTLGFGPSQWPALKALWQAESGWNPLAHNKSSGAHGIPQSLPASKMRSEGADYWTNPATQIRWGLKYIKSRYGSPSAAWSFWQRQSPHWYDQGGLAKGVGAWFKNTNRPERVLSPRQTAAFESLVAALPLTAGAPSGSGFVIQNLTLAFQGPVGSRRELENWLVSSFDQLQRQGRIKGVTK